MNKVCFLRGYTCTDPDNLQFAKKISDGVWEYQQLIDTNPLFDQYKGHYGLLIADYENNVGDVQSNIDKSDNWFQGAIHLNEYDADDIGNCLNAYGYSPDNREGWGQETWDQIACECIFETYMLTDFAPDSYLC